MAKAYGGVMILADIVLIVLKLIYYVCECVYKIFSPPEEKSVAGEIVLVTGAGHGMGRGLALKYASLGATVVCWDINQEANEETVNEIKKLGAAKAYAYQCDVSQRDEVMKVAEKVKNEVGDVTILVNNAGIMPCHTLLDHKPEQVKRIFDINVLAHIWTLQAFLPSMVEKNHGHIVALSSIAGLLGLTNLVPYCGSKFAVRGMMEALKEELRIQYKEKALNIKFTTVCPYMVDTGLCKKPKVRFPSIMGLVSPQEAVEEIVKAQRQGLREFSIPKRWAYISCILRCFPALWMDHVVDFLDSGVEADS